MRVIWPREIDALFIKNLSAEELRQYAESFEVAYSSFEELRKISNFQSKLFRKAVGCYCDMAAFRDDSFIAAEWALGGDVKAYSKERTTPEYRAALSKVARKYTRKRRCHINLRAMVCYCDEHSH